MTTKNNKLNISTLINTGVKFEKKKTLKMQETRKKRLCHERLYPENKV
jgi:hypothetical protein